MKTKLLWLVALGMGLVMQLAYADRINDMMSVGKNVTVFSDRNRGRTVLAIGLADRTRSKSKDLAMARANAYEVLTGFLNGTRVTSESRMQIESVNGVTSDAFFSEVKTNSSGALRATEIERSGTTSDGLVFVAMRISENTLGITNALKTQLESSELRAVGIASLDLGRDKARRQALDDALRNAVAMHNGVATASQSTVTNASNLRSRMATRTNGAVSKYRVASEGAKSGVYRVEIVATVEEELIDPDNAVGAIRENMGRPSFYVATSNSKARRTLEKLLKRAKLDVSRSAASARFVIDMNLEIEESPVLGGMLGRKTFVTLKIKDSLSNDQIAVISSDPDASLEVSDSKQLRERRSLRYAIDSVEDELVASIGSSFVDQFNNGAKVSVELQGFDRMRMVDMFQQLLESLPLTKKVNARPISNAIAKFEMLYLGDPSELQLLVVKQAKDHRLFGLRAKNKTGDGLAFTF